MKPLPPILKLRFEDRLRTLMARRPRPAGDDQQREPLDEQQRQLRARAQSIEQQLRLWSVQPQRATTPNPRLRASSRATANDSLGVPDAAHDSADERDPDPGPALETDVTTHAPAAARAADAINNTVQPAFAMVAIPGPLARGADAGALRLTPQNARLAVSATAAEAVLDERPPITLLLLPAQVCVVHKLIVQTSCDDLLDSHMHAYLRRHAARAMTGFMCCGVRLPAGMLKVLVEQNRARVKIYLKAHLCGSIAYDRSMPFPADLLATMRARPTGCQVDFCRRVCVHIAMILANDVEGLARVATELDATSSEPEGGAAADARSSSA